MISQYKLHCVPPEPGHDNRSRRCVAVLRSLVSLKYLAKHVHIFPHTDRLIFPTLSVYRSVWSKAVFSICPRSGRILSEMGRRNV